MTLLDAHFPLEVGLGVHGAVVVVLDGDLGHGLTPLVVVDIVVMEIAGGRHGEGDSFFDWQHLIMPAFALGWYFLGSMVRITRPSMLDVLGTEYIKLARLKGLPEWAVMAKHAIKNAMIPVLTLAGLNLVIMVNVAIAIEVVFNWPGIGQLLFDGMSNRDFPMVQGIVLMSGVMIVILNFGIDILYAYVDPRIRLAK